MYNIVKFKYKNIQVKYITYSSFDAGTQPPLLLQPCTYLLTQGL